jgi:hypothetical protein
MNNDFGYSSILNEIGSKLKIKWEDIALNLFKNISFAWLLPIRMMKKILKYKKNIFLCWPL